MLLANMSRYADFHKQCLNPGLCVCVCEVAEEVVAEGGHIGLDPVPCVLTKQSVGR